MATLVAITQHDGDPKYATLAIGASVTLYPGAGAMIVTATGLLIGAADTAAHVAAGIVEPEGQSEEDVDNGSGLAGAISARIRTLGLAEIGAAAPDQTWVGQKVYWTDNNTVELAATAANDIPAGVCREFDTAGNKLVMELIGLGRS